MRQQSHQKRQVRLPCFSVKPDLKEWQRGKQQQRSFRRRPSLQSVEKYQKFQEPV